MIWNNAMLTVLLAALLVAPAPGSAAAAVPVQPQNNVHSAGHLAGSRLTVRLVAGMGTWRPIGSAGPALDVAAFGEEGAPLSAPGPLIRVTAGTEVVAAVRNGLPGDLRIFGLCARPGPCDPLVVPAAESREVRFTLHHAGTYYYWASTTAGTLTSRPRIDTQLGGAIVVDAPNAGNSDRIMIISMYADGPRSGICGAATAGNELFTINGASWPETERLKYLTGSIARWRVINLSCDQHAMHLHGFHFDIESVGNGESSRRLSPAERQTVVTRLIDPGGTFAMSWRPTREGNWLFHCHMVPHMAAAQADGHSLSHAGMAGLVMGVHVSAATADAHPAEPVSRRFSLVLRKEANRYGTSPGYRMDVEGLDAPRLDPGAVPGPVLVLYRGQATEITVVNRMDEPSAIHWHGLEIDSYFDGVPGFGGAAGKLAPAVEPGQSFRVEVTPPRSGTFIYHTHWHDEAQLAGGLYGPLVVLEPGESFDPQTDHIAVIGLNGKVLATKREPFALNGLSSPAPIRMRAGVPNRLRLINITAANAGLVASVREGGDLIQWTPVAKDGASLPIGQRNPRSSQQPITVGETYDFELAASTPKNLWLEVRRRNGEWVLQAPIEVR